MTKHQTKLAVTKLANDYFDSRIMAQIAYDHIDEAISVLSQKLEIDPVLKPCVAARILAIAAQRTEDYHTPVD